MRATLWLASLGLLALGACATERRTTRRPPPIAPPVTPTERYAIKVSPDPLELKLGAARRRPVARTRRTRCTTSSTAGCRPTAAPITIKAPEHGPDAAAVYRTARRRARLPDRPGRRPATGADRRLRRRATSMRRSCVGFIRYEAQGPQCGSSWGDLSTTPQQQAATTSSAAR